ncbi:MAG TPA: Uma2 family endonuclease [Thermoanaerobaculia bacterium]|jgi:Uma2 family endonuclease
MKTTFHGESDEPDDASSGAVMLQRWVERPDGHLELQEKPLTLEDYLDPQLEDKLTQGRPHSDVCRVLAELLSRHFQPDEDVIVLQDVKHLFGPGLPGPSPDISVILGARNKEFSTFDAVEQGVFPSFVIEVISPFDARVRRMDEVDKVELYQRVGIPEYLLVDMPRRATGYRFRIKGYRLGPGRRYQAIEPDGQGRILSEITQLRFGASPDGQRIEIFVAGTGERLLSPLEIEAARETAEEELKRLRAEIERLKKP